MNSDLPTLALKFARSCLGWHSPEFGETLTKRKYIQQLDRNGFDKLYYEELGSVMEFVRGWIDEGKRDIDFRYSAKQRGWGVFCSGVDAWDRDIRVALLSACTHHERAG